MGIDRIEKDKPLHAKEFGQWKVTVHEVECIGDPYTIGSFTEYNLRVLCMNNEMFKETFSDEASSKKAFNAVGSNVFQLQSAQNLRERATTKERLFRETLINASENDDENNDKN